MARFGQMAELANETSRTASRLKKRARIAEEISAVQAGGAGDVGLFCLYLAGLPFAAADARKLNAGGALLSKALLAVSGANGAELNVAFRRHGDMGAAAGDLLREKGRTGTGGLTLLEVSDAFAAMAGAKTTAIRTALVEALLTRATPVEATYLLKLMLGDMRIGVKESLVEEAIADAAGAEVAAVRHAVMLEADLGAAAERAFAGTLGEARMRLFHPLGFMLASPVETPEEAVLRFSGGKKRKSKGAMAEALAADTIAAGLEEEKDSTEDTEDTEDALKGTQATPAVRAFLEDKFDGMRAQVHCGAADAPGRVAIYSRNREEITESFPELVEAFAGAATDDASGLIFDGEILGWDYTRAQALPFAVLGQRIGRKRVDNATRRAVPVVFMAFDLMFSAGELLLALPLRVRRERLEDVVEAMSDRARAPLVRVERKVQGLLFGDVDEDPTHRGEAAMNEASAQAEPLPRLMLSSSRLVESAEEIDRAYAEARARANEGVMLKAADSAYQPGRRGLSWVKLKRTLETLDVVITGAEWGNGRKSQFLSDYTFAVRDGSGDLKNVGKAYSGVTDAEIAWLTEFLKEHTLEESGHFRTVEPLIVLEVAFNNIMRSDRHASGFALRFPRILRIRNDKPLEEIDTVARVEEIYQSQVDKPAESAVDVQRVRPYFPPFICKAGE